VEAWFRKRPPGFVAGWAKDNPAVAEQYVKENPEAVAGWFKENLATYRGKSADAVLAEVKADNAGAAKQFFTEFARAHERDWPAVDNKKVQPKRRDSEDIQGYFFDLWLRENRGAVLKKVQADMVMASGSGLDPHITFKNAHDQLKYRVAEEQAKKLIGQIEKEKKATLDEARREKVR